MNDWVSLFRSLTADTLDSVDSQSTANADTAAAPHSVKSVKSVSASKAEEQDAAIRSPASASLSRSLTGDTLDTVDTVSTAHVDVDEPSTSGRHGVNSVQSVPESTLVAALAILEGSRPDHVEADDWQHAVEDGRRLLIQWGEQSTALGWAEADIFGLPPVPSDRHPAWERLRRLDQLGLVWLTHGRPVTSITAESATIRTPRGGSVAFYRKGTFDRRGGRGKRDQWNDASPLEIKHRSEAKRVKRRRRFTLEPTAYDWFMIVTEDYMAKYPLERSSPPQRVPVAPPPLSDLQQDGSARQEARRYLLNAVRLWAGIAFAQPPESEASLWTRMQCARLLAQVAGAIPQEVPEAPQPRDEHGGGGDDDEGGGEAA